MQIDSESKGTSGKGERKLLCGARIVLKQFSVRVSERFSTLIQD